MERAINKVDNGFSILLENLFSIRIYFKKGYHDMSDIYSQKYVSKKSSFRFLGIKLSVHLKN